MSQLNFTGSDGPEVEHSPSVARVLESFPGKVQEEREQGTSINA
jgi:hypothetical protein